MQWIIPRSLRRLKEGMKRRSAIQFASPERDAPNARDDASISDPREQAAFAYLKSHDGWAWQANVQVGLGWSAAKTSEVLSAMEDRSLVVRHRLGRSNIVCLPGYEPDGVPIPG